MLLRKSRPIPDTGASGPAPAPFSCNSLPHCYACFGADSAKLIPKPATVASAGQGQGLVLVNETSELYHCYGDCCYGDCYFGDRYFGDRYFGKTLQGKYKTEAAAKTLWCVRVA